MRFRATITKAGKVKLGIIVETEYGSQDTARVLAPPSNRMRGCH